MSVVALTILWSVGIAALIPTVVNAVDCPTLVAGDLVMVNDKSSSAVWVLDAGLKRIYFPNEDVYKTWYATSAGKSDWSLIKKVAPSCLETVVVPAAAPFGVNFFPGSTVLKLEGGTKYFVTEAGNKKTEITEAAAAELFGSTWKTGVKTYSQFFSTWAATDGVKMEAARLPDGALVKKAAGDTYQVVAGKLNKVDGTLTGAAAKAVRTVSDTLFATGEVATTTVTPASLTANPVQTTGTGTGTGTGTTVTGGNLSVALAADTPASGYVYKGSTHNAFTKLSFTAGAKDVTINSMVVQRTGAPASDSAIAGINVLKNDGSLLSSAYKTLNSDHQVTFTEDVVVAANTTVNLTLVGKIDTGTSYGGEVPKLALVSLDTNGTVQASLPIEGNAMTINKTITIGVATITESPDLGTLTEEVGTTDVEFLNVHIDNDSANNINLLVDSIRFNNAGSADDSDVANLELVVDGSVVATASMVSNYVTFNLTGVAKASILNGKDETFLLRGDIVGGSGRSIDFDIKKADDIKVRDTLNGAYVTPSAAIDSGRTITISRGTLNVSKTNTVKAVNIPEDTTNLELASWNFKVQGEPITVSSLAFSINVNGTVQAADFTAMKLVNSKGVSLTGTFDGVGAGDGTVTTTDSFTLPEGDNELKLVGKLNADGAAGDYVEFSIDMSYAAGLDAKGDVTGDTITVGTYAFPSARVTANRQTLATGALSITTVSQPAAATVAAGTSGQHFSTVSLSASASSEDVKVTAFTFNVTTTAAETNQLQNITFKVNDTADGTYRTLSTTKNGSKSTAGADELITVTLPTADQIIIKKGTTVTMKIYADVSASCSANDKFQIEINNVANDVPDAVPTVTAEGVLTGTAVAKTYSASAANAMTVGTAGGQVAVALASDTATGQLMAAGTTVNLAAFSFLATTTEDVELDYLYLTQVQTLTASSSYKDYDEIWFEDATGKEIAGTRMTPTSTIPYIDFYDEAFVVEADGSAEKLYLKAKLATVGSCASLTCTGANGRPGNHLGYKITTASTDVVAVGHNTGSGTTEYAGNVAPTGNTHYVYKAYPVVTKENLTAGLANGTRDLFKFKVAAMNGDIGLGGFTFDISTTTASIVLSTCYLYDVTESNEKQVNTTGGCAGTATLNYGTGLVWQTVGHADDWDVSGGAATNDEIVVAVNVPRTFVLRGNVTGAASGASITTGLCGDLTGLASVTGAGATNMLAAATVDGIAQDDFIWSDLNDNGHSDATTDWTNGYLVSGLTSTTSTLQTVAFGS